MSAVVSRTRRIAKHWVLHCIIQCRKLRPYPEEQNILFLICICTCIAAPPSYSCTCLFTASRLSLQLQLYQPLTMPRSLHPIEVVGITARRRLLLQTFLLQANDQELDTSHDNKIVEISDSVDCVAGPHAQQQGSR